MKIRNYKEKMSIWNFSPKISQQFSGIQTSLKNITIYCLSRINNCYLWPYLLSPLYKEPLFSFTREGSSDTCYNMDEPRGHYAK